MITSINLKSATALALLLSSPITQGVILFEVEFTDAALIQYTTAEQQMFTDGLAYWDSVIDGHQDGVNRGFTLNVDSFSAARSGGTITLGSAGITSRGFSGSVSGATPSFGQYILSNGGNASFNIHPDAGPLRADVIQHEIGHSLGIGTLWEDNQLHNDGVAGNHNRTGAGAVGQYTGAYALAAYRAEFDSSALFIPVEQGGGGGTAFGHWDEVDGGGVATGITNANGQDFRDELMTGWASPAETNTFVSNTTIQSLRDLGFTLHAGAPIPEPSSTVLIGLGSCVLLLRRRR